MTTKVLNKLVNICSTLDGGTTSSDSTTSGATISTSVYDYTVSVSEGTEYFNLAADINEGDSTTIKLTFTTTDAFDSDDFSYPCVEVKDSGGSRILYMDINYDGTQFSLSGVLCDYSYTTSSDSSGFTCSIQYTSTELSFPLSVILYVNTSPKTTYTISQEGEVDSSNLLTFGAIDEVYVRKTDFESLKASFDELNTWIEERKDKIDSIGVSG